MKWLDNIPYVIIVPLAVLLGLAPFTPEPHLWEKLKMLFTGTLVRPIDIFDLFLHGTPLLILLLKLVYSGRKAA
jgi:ABC-type arginine/histidine transport system permease subunit